jgi:hypothetical protein
MNRFPRVSPSYGRPRYKVEGPIRPCDTGTVYEGPKPWTMTEQTVRQAIRDRRALDRHAHTKANLTPRLVDNRPGQFTNRPIWA